MPIYKCAECGVIENTAIGGYWTRELDARRRGVASPPPLCSQCNPKIAQWHGEFDRTSAAGYLIGEDGFLHHRYEVRPGHTRIAGMIGPDGEVTADTCPLLVQDRSLHSHLGVHTLEVRYLLRGAPGKLRLGHGEDLEAALDALIALPAPAAAG